MCPREFVADVRDVIRAAAFADKGIWPHRDGWADWPAVLVQAIEYFWVCEAETRAKLKLT